MDHLRRRNWWNKIDGTNGVIAIVSCVLWGVLFILKPTPLVVPENDSGSSFPRDEKNALPTALMGAVLAAVFFIVFISALLSKRYFPKYITNFNGWTFIWAFIAAEGISGLCVSLFKNYVGRSRPDLFAICGKNVDINNPDSCPNLTKREFYDQFRSWPSGHSQTAMSGFVIIALFVQKVINANNLISSFCGSLFIILAIWCGATRIRDYKHRPDDVLAGFFIGYIFAQFIWLQMVNRIFPGEEPDIIEDKSVIDVDLQQYEA
ncbi:PAP2 superfamily protein [Trichomonas vaginalis G3]|uniref:PAP2 superfamily protein n=1 Tax=Trichomonas vaginalis (strain ATCC PRA-98 / G3) TaxID=412133 RepID=A2EPP6_TRIV3|nr:phosphatidate phosphatase protein [Trichomonas vaginalis G3]EAY05389.1 PAP2 superfamily protein [Trichomonas vaginalis G3]KAI5524078.1 phosphatidate phosphatase protein [Trichomonas vaginalis G3]|eukprot:XP_001317612.1 PAP2 superfamily protein [Trichomonas vaginalis G3]